MSTRWNDIFQLPDTALAGDKRVPKTMLVQQAALTKHEQKTLDKMRRLEHFATATKATTRILPRVDDERDIQSVIFLRCEMAGTSQAVAEVAHLVHKCFPNPTVIMQDVGDKICVSVSLTRKSHAERGATVMEMVESTGLFDAKTPEWQPFLDTIAYPRLPQGDLYEYLRAMAGNVMLSRAIDALGFYPQVRASDQERILALVNRYDVMRSEVRQLYEQRKMPEVTLNESAKLRIRIRKAENQQNAILDEIKELCNG